MHVRIALAANPARVRPRSSSKLRRPLVHSPVITGVVWLIGTLALGFYAWVVAFVFALGVTCEPGCLS